MSFGETPYITEIADVFGCIKEIRDSLRQTTKNDWFHVEDVAMFHGNADKVVGPAADSIMARVYMNYPHLKEESKKKRKDMSFLGNSKLYCTILMMINIELLKFIASEYYRPEKLEKLNVRIRNAFNRLKDVQQKAKTKYLKTYKDKEYV